MDSTEQRRSYPVQSLTSLTTWVAEKAVLAYKLEQETGATRKQRDQLKKRLADLSWGVPRWLIGVAEREQNPLLYALLDWKLTTNKRFHGIGFHPGEG